MKLQRKINTYRIGKTYCKATLTRFREHCNEHYNEYTKTDWFHHSWFISLNSFKQVDVCMKSICASNKICKKKTIWKLEKNGNDERGIRLNGLGKWKGEWGGDEHMHFWSFYLLGAMQMVFNRYLKTSLGMWDCKQQLHFSGFEFYFSRDPYTHIGTFIWYFNTFWLDENDQNLYCAHCKKMPHY